jgi:hypothetical protein
LEERSYRNFDESSENCDEDSDDDSVEVLGSRQDPNYSRRYDRDIDESDGNSEHSDEEPSDHEHNPKSARSHQFSKLPPIMRTLQQMEEELAQLQAENTKLKAKHAKTMPKLVRKSGKHDKNDPHPLLIKKKFREEIWRTYKFITSDAQEKTITGSVCDIIDIPEAKDEQWRELWIANYSSVCSRELNQTRSYVLARLKDASFAYMDRNDGDLFSEADILACLSRKVMPELHECFDWYVNNYLPHATANADHWSTGKRHYSTLSVCGRPKAARKLYVPPSTEAFAVTAFECFRTAWVELWALKKKYPRTKFIPRKKPKDSEAPPYVVGQGGDKVYLYDAKFKGKWTVPDAGQSKYGGWTTEGVMRFVELKDVNKAARSKPTSSKMEMDCLSRLRKVHGITAPNPTENMVKKRQTIQQDMDNITDGPQEIDVFGDED